MENEITIKNVCCIDATLSSSIRHAVDEHGNHLIIDDVISIAIPHIEDVELFEGDMVRAMSIPQAKAFVSSAPSSTCRKRQSLTPTHGCFKSDIRIGTAIVSENR